jgi:1-acyl-sn-glycerol-3-phosphate acyltransferase
MNKNDDDTGKFVYEAIAPGWWSQSLAIITMTFLFVITLCYMIIVPAALYYMFLHHSIWMLGIIVFVCSSPFWALGTWHAIGESIVFHTWRLYFQFRVYKECDMPQSKKILFTSFPHGLFPIAIPMMSGICKKIFPELDKPVPIAAVAENMFKIPIVAPLLTWFGCVPAKAEYIREAIQKETCILLPDGIAGVFVSNPEEEILYISKRKGFIRIAIEEGATLVPMYCFGHTQLFTKFPHHESWIANLSRRIRFSIVFFVGHSLLPPLPRRVPLLVVVGRPFKVEQCDKPSEELIEHTLGAYIQEIHALFERNKHRYGWHEKKLNIH